MGLKPVSIWQILRICHLAEKSKSKVVVYANCQYRAGKEVSINLKFADWWSRFAESAKWRLVFKKVDQEFRIDTGPLIGLK
jgi:hypothetical protein